MIHSRFDLAFAQAHIFSGPQGPIRAVVHRVCDLRLTSGRIVACDPWWPGAPFARAIAPGSYPVELCVTHWSPNPHYPNLVGAQYVAAAQVQLRPEPAVAWEMAVIAEENLNDLRPNAFFGFGVGSGMACFVDADALSLISEDGADTRGDLQAELGRRLRGNGAVEGVELALPTGNLVAFGAGPGDGRYPCYWGLDQDRNAVSLIADFGVLVQAIWDSAVVPSIGSVPNGSLRLGALEAASLHADWTVTGDKAVLTVRGERASSTRAELVSPDGGPVAHTFRPRREAGELEVEFKTQDLKTNGLRMDFVTKVEALS